MARRAKNTTGRTLAKAGFWRALFGQTMTREQFERLHRENGSQQIAREFTLNRDSLRASRQLHRDCANVSAFRTTDAERRRFFLVVIGESENAGELTHARRVMDRFGGRPVTLPASVLDTFRRRRWELRIDTALCGSRRL